MKTLDQIEGIVDLDARVIHAAALLEAELRGLNADRDREATLGDLVQRQTCFAKHEFLRDLNNALRVRNAIAHLADGIEPSSDEKTTAAADLVQAIQLVRHSTGQNADAAALKSQEADSFDAALTQAAIEDIHRRRRIVSAILAMVVLAVAAVGAGVMSVQVGIQAVPLRVALMILFVGILVALSIFVNGLIRKPLGKSDYYSLPGSRFSNGDHRCIHCGSRGRNDRGIYTHGQYKSDKKFHDCSKCTAALYTS